MGKLHDPTSKTCLYNSQNANADARCPTCDGDHPEIGSTGNSTGHHLRFETLSRVQFQGLREVRIGAIQDALKLLGEDRLISDLLEVADWLLQDLPPEPVTVVNNVHVFNPVNDTEQETSRTKRMLNLMD